jgi:hypothetical protein
MKPLVVIGILLVASGTALVYYSSRRGSQADNEAAIESTAPVLESGVESSTQSEIEASNRVWPIYARVLSRIREHLETHVTGLGDSRITVDLPPLPENLYTDRYSGTVIFGDEIVWTVELFAPRPADLRSPPTLTIRFDDPTDLQEGPRLILSLDTVDREVAIIATNGIAPSVGAIPDGIPEDDPDAAIAQLTRSIVEGQLLRLGRANL